MAKSVRFNCSNRSTSCHTKCRAYQAESEARLYIRHQRMMEQLGEYKNGLDKYAMKQKIADRAGGRI